MKVQTAVLLLCFLSGVFLLVVHAKPSPALIRELIALEKYLEKKEGSEGTDGRSENQGVKLTDEELTKNKEQEEEKNPTEDGNDKPKNENNNNGETNTAEGSGPVEGDTKITPGQETDVPPAKPEEGFSSDNAEGSGPSDNVAPNEDGGFPASGGTMKVDSPKVENPSEGQVKNERDQIYKDLDEITRNIKGALDKLSQLGEAFRAQFQNDDRKFAELENNSKKAKESTTEKIGQIKAFLDEFKRSTVGLDETPSVGKESVRENAPARRSHISDTEFLNMLHSLLTYS